MATLPAGNPIKCVINKKCEAHPQISLLVLGIRNQIQWKAQTKDTYYLWLPGGYFEGHLDDFELTITETDFLPIDPLIAIQEGRILNYIFDSKHKPCQTKAEPPEIIIGS